MTRAGGCHCGAIRYEVSGDANSSALCHCTDCRRCSGAPMVAWAMFPISALRVIKGVAKVYVSSEQARRHFCVECGTGLFYVNEHSLPGIVDVQTATLDDPNAIAPKVHVQTAETIAWMERVGELQRFERFPSAK